MTSVSFFIHPQPLGFKWSLKPHFAVPFAQPHAHFRASSLTPRSSSCHRLAKPHFAAPFAQPHAHFALLPSSLHALRLAKTASLPPACLFFFPLPSSYSSSSSARVHFFPSTTSSRSPDCFFPFFFFPVLSTCVLDTSLCFWWLFFLKCRQPCPNFCSRSS